MKWLNLTSLTTHKEHDMKLWELIYWHDGVHCTECQWGATKMQARSVIVQRYKCQIDFISVTVVEEAEA